MANAVVVTRPQALRELVGQEVAISDWFSVTQEQIQQFAEVTGDRQWIHTDPQRAAKDSPYGTTIAHGFLTLALLSQFLQQAIRVEGVRLAVNYGLNRVRFPAPVRAGARVRARFSLQALKDVSGGLEAIWAITVEGQGAEKPCCVAEWMVRYYA